MTSGQPGSLCEPCSPSVEGHGMRGGFCGLHWAGHMVSTEWMSLSSSPALSFQEATQASLLWDTL